MPHLIFRGVTIDQVKSVSQPLVKELSTICACGEDNFSLEVLRSAFIENGEEVQPYPFVEVKWFERGDDVRDQFAKAITKYILDLGVNEVEVAFIAYTESVYYINGKSCS